MANDKNSNAVRIDTLPNEQLQHLGKQLEQDLVRLQQSAQLLASLAGEYQVSESAVQELKELEDGAVHQCPLGIWISSTIVISDEKHLYERYVDARSVV
jgi:hypothetical protein